jgi:hypothetical protein
MKTVKIAKAELIKVLKINRDAHHSIFLEALDGYRKEVIKQLEKSLDDAKAGKKVRQTLELVEPMNQTKDYDRAIRMLEMSIESVVDITEHEFQCYVQDDWSWKSQFVGSNINYSSTLNSNPEFASIRNE